ncbi:MAG TPA: efflux transporter outer membrane subunit [Rhodocyclaceae bacterium]|nr:efflux transporter outer membrane subunit [Rhodocyclaceae bacterium]HRQ48011.1 efflux transporter outer membrane subunit [Rhodocyclaceae bacterium]
MTASLRSLAVAATAVVLAAGCAHPLRVADPGVTMPISWTEAVAASPTALQLESRWWKRFGSVELEALIDEALAGNPDLAIATERVVQAEIAARSAGASLFPRVDLNAATSARASDGGAGASREQSSSVAIGISYEIDIWGSNITRLRGSRAQLMATRHDYEAARLSIVAAIANAYTQVLAQRARLEIAYENLAIAERLFAIVESRYRHGAASALDLSRQRTQVLSQRDAIVPMQVQERQSLRALAILIGRVPQDFDISGPGFGQLAIPELDVPLPGELLARRPDLAAVEARLAAADADIGVARAALFPLRLSLGSSAGLSSTDFGLVNLGNPASTVSITLSLIQAVFDGGRLRGQVEASESQYRQVLESYRGTILTALKEVDDALAAVERSRIQEQAQLEIRTETERSLRLSELRYREGSDSLGTLLDAQRSLFASQDQLVQQRLARINATVDLYKALGGGWLVGF